MLTGYIFDDLNWCDKNITGGKEYTTACGCTGKAEMVYAFWKSASNAYSKRVQNEVGIILNGSISSPFNKNSTLATVELPNLKKPQVKQVTAYIVHDLEEGHYRFIKHYQCIWAPTNRQCQLSSSSRIPDTLNNIWAPVFLTLLIGISVQPI
ncbi:hypothetical protein P879_07229 [Paragonimus westermani]|uniref:ADP-ribosyl cyclase/cyclic ADP-ribose hydrolase n=1 Tax=Paragonimus westermani TaxID=34504 RepID=A0A8T0DQL8_9TREM|nr:hypothetical protein P879_07229 [Paragonimus westermani]